MAKKPKADHTACPNCGHSPLSADDERCPSCYAALRALPSGHAARAHFHNDAEQEMMDAVGGTRIGGFDIITSDAEAHPGMTAALLACLAIFIAAAGMRFVPASGPANQYLFLAAVNALLAILLVPYPTVVRPMVALFALVDVFALGYIGRGETDLPALLSLVVAPLPLLLGVSGEPGAKRRGLTLALGLGLLLYSGTVRLGSRYFGAVGPTIDLPKFGFRLKLPVGFTTLRGPDALSPYLPLTELDPQMAIVSFADPTRDSGGLWGLAPAGRYQYTRLALGLAASLDVSTGDPAPVSIGLNGLKLPQATYERQLARGVQASVTAFRLPDDRTAVLAVSAPTADLDAIRQELARGATFEGVEHPVAAAHH